MKRRNFIKNSASAALFTGIAGCSTETDDRDKGNSKTKPGLGTYYQQGRTAGSAPFSIIEEGRKIRKIETYSKETVALVKVTTDSGEEGWGQISTYNSDIASTVLHRNLAGHFIGRDPAHVDVLVDRCIESNLKYPWSYVNRALGGLDTALWDLYGKIRGKPVCELLGGTCSPVPIYGSSMSRSITAKEELDRMQQLRDEKGIEAFKFRIGKEASRNMDAWEGRSEEVITTLGPELSKDCSLLADANSCYTPDRAIHYGKMMEDYGVVQFEEPCPYWEYEWTREVTSALNMDVSGGEQDNDLSQWRRMINMHTFDIIQPDPLYLGGITRTWRAAIMAHEKGIPCIPHSANHALVTVFALHLMRAIPNPGKYLEYSIEFDASINREARAMYEPYPEVMDGVLNMPLAPGWGITIREEWLGNAVYAISEMT